MNQDKCTRVCVRSGVNTTLSISTAEGFNCVLLGNYFNMHNAFLDLNTLGSSELRVERRDESSTLGRDLLLLFVFFFEKNNCNSNAQRTLHIRGSWKSHEWIHYKLLSVPCRFVVKDKLPSLNWQDKSRC